MASHTIPVRVPMISDLRGQTMVSLSGVYSVEESTFSASYGAQEGIGTRASKIGLEYARRFPNMNRAGFSPAAGDVEHRAATGPTRSN